jgi:hypothetical protein
MGNAVNKPGDECTNNTACYTRQALLYMITITTETSGYPFHRHGVTAHLACKPGGPLVARARQQNLATPRHEGGVVEDTPYRVLSVNQVDSQTIAISTRQDGVSSQLILRLFFGYFKSLHLHSIRPVGPNLLHAQAAVFIEHQQILHDIFVRFWYTACPGPDSAPPVSAPTNDTGRPGRSG